MLDPSEVIKVRECDLSGQVRNEWCDVPQAGKLYESQAYQSEYGEHASIKTHFICQGCGICWADQTSFYII